MIIKAKELLAKGEIEEAIRILLEEAKNNPDREEVWLLISGVATRTENWELGAESFRKLVQLRPSSPLASSGLVKCYFELQRNELLLEEVYRFAEQASPDDEDSVDVMRDHRDFVMKVERYKK